MKDFSVTILGSSSAVPTSTRFPSAQVVSYHNKLFLVDCGEGTQIQLRKNQFRFSKLNHIFISHLHGDHFFGLIGLLSTFNLLGRKESVHLYAPEAIRDVIEVQLNVSLTELRYPLVYHSLNFEEKQLVYEDKFIEVFSFPLKHSIPTCGFLFQEKPLDRKILKSKIKTKNISVGDFDRLKKGEDILSLDGELIKASDYTEENSPARTYAYCSDTVYNEALVEHLSSVDLLYHEASFTEDFKEVAKEKLHSTASEAAQIAKLAAVKRLLIGHYSARYKDSNVLLVEAEKVFPETIIAYEGLKVVI